MELLLKKSHAYICLLFCVLCCASASACLARALSNKFTWGQFFGMTLLMVVVSAVLCVGGAYCFTAVQTRLLHREEELEDYLVTHDKMYVASGMMLFAVAIGFAFG